MPGPPTALHDCGLMVLVIRLISCSSTVLFALRRVTIGVPPPLLVPPPPPPLSIEPRPDDPADGPEGSPTGVPPVME